MPKPNIITVPSFSDFVAEVEAGEGQVVRLCLGERYSPDRYGSGDNTFAVPACRVTLDLQGPNDLGELVWLSREVRIRWSNDGPATPDDREKYEAMYSLRRIVQERLSELGYTVRPGRHVLPNGHQPINGVFDCAEWYRDEENRLEVQAVIDE